MLQITVGKEHNDIQLAKIKIMMSIYTTDDPMESKRIVKSLDMAIALWEIKHNLWRKFEESDVDYDPVFEAINNIFDLNAINIDELVD